MENKTFEGILHIQPKNCKSCTEMVKQPEMQKTWILKLTTVYPYNLNDQLGLAYRQDATPTLAGN